MSPRECLTSFHSSLMNAPHDYTTTTISFLSFLPFIFITILVANPHPKFSQPLPVENSHLLFVIPELLLLLIAATSSPSFSLSSHVAVFFVSRHEKPSPTASFMLLAIKFNLFLLSNSQFTLNHV